MKRLAGLVLTGAAALGSAAVAFAAPDNRYLAYKEPAAAGGSGWLGTAAYMITLLLVFAGVLWAAYTASRWFGGRMNRMQAANGASVVGAVSLGGTRQAVFLRVGEKILLLGVTDQQVNLLREIDDEQLVQQFLQQPSLEGTADRSLFSDQLQLLDELEKRLPGFVRARKKNQPPV